MAQHGEEEPSAWVRRFAPLIRGGGKVLDLACGRGRHARLLRDLGYAVIALDRDKDALDGLKGERGIEILRADVEAGEWPFSPRSFDGMVVTNYLHRPLFPRLREALAAGGVLVYETFAAGNERYGRPSNPAFLLARDELLEQVRPLEIIAFEQGCVSVPRPAVVQRICAARGEQPPGPALLASLPIIPLG
jgi:SAM-dependent methyltransferase